ncbi:diguanylate cyclase [Catenovulum sp. 2E275]|uniref:GGDEF domain-containing protein n=1 Tax=Catenovulum sp. 2E275 TaxID=2980497 RepID=UPI0021CF8AD0|nr:diguanylate cyclase [Catenovulum sp. 2E275]MCU4677025.1 diguanylate cyclase [Catenovulum sp. 2E275]
MSLLIRLSSIVFVLLICFTTQATQLGENEIIQTDNSIWYPINLKTPINDQQLANLYKQSDLPVGSLLGQRGGAITRLTLSTDHNGIWYVMPVANFVDEGKAFWQDHTGKITQIADFSQFKNRPTVINMHGQAFKLALDKGSHGTLWIYLNAKHYPTPVHISILPENRFLQNAFMINSITVMAITIMLTLAIMALIFYLKTKHKVAIFCFGYIGLHGVGWALAAGLGQIINPMFLVNTTYGGMYLFPFAIACASYFAYYLFNFDQSAQLKNQFLVYYAHFALIAGLTMWFLPFKLVFYWSHLLAGIWVSISLFVGYKMLSLNDFRAKYFFTGNLIYSLALIYYMLSHFADVQGISPEIIVLIALSADCICILLSLSEWLRLKQNQLQKMMHESRYDALTKVGNRLLLNEKIHQLNGHYLIVFIDCDNIKKLNDQLGHAKGDQFLIYTSQLMQQKLADKGEVFRTGGDEFIWVCETHNSEHLNSVKFEVSKILEEINHLIKSHWPVSGISYGVATNEEGSSVSDCLSLADSRMYELKSKHKIKKKPDSLVSR